MRSIKLPALQFSLWTAWDERRQIPGYHMPGIYLIAITHKRLAGLPPQDNWADVSYIGMTHSRQGLNGRWRQFSRSIHGKPGHSGGNTIYANLGNYDAWDYRNKLFVAAMSIECNVVSPTADDLIKTGWVRYLEYEAFAEFSRNTKKSGKPKYNTQ